MQPPAPHSCSRFAQGDPDEDSAPDCADNAISALFKLAVFRGVELGPHVASTVVGFVLQHVPLTHDAEEARCVTPEGVHAGPVSELLHAPDTSTAPSSLASSTAISVWAAVKKTASGRC